MSDDSARLRTLACAEVVDARGRRRPGPVLAAKRALVAVPVGEVLELVASDPHTVTELPSWSAKTGQQFLGSYVDHGDWHLFVRRLA